MPLRLPSQLLHSLPSFTPHIHPYSLRFPNPYPHRRTSHTARKALHARFVLPFAIESWYDSQMVKAYVAIVNPHGLEAFFPDADCIASAVLPGPVNRRAGQRVMLWAAVTDDVAAQIREYIRLGDRHQALLHLDTLATQVAPFGQVYTYPCNIADGELASPKEGTHT
jgi:hypothetical protein